MSSSFYRAVDSFLSFLGVGNVGWAYGASVLITGLITSSVGADLRSLGTYFTNWSLIIQLAAYIAFLKNPKSHIWLFDLATVLVWTVALSFSIVTIVSGQMRAQMYALYGSLGFWAGNIIIHYLPLLFNYSAFYHAFLKDGKNSPVNSPPQSPLHVGVVAFSAASESLCFFFSLNKLLIWKYQAFLLHMLQPIVQKRFTTMNWMSLLDLTGWALSSWSQPSLLFLTGTLWMFLTYLVPRRSRKNQTIIYLSVLLFIKVRECHHLNKPRDPSLQKRQKEKNPNGRVPPYIRDDARPFLRMLLRGSPSTGPE